MSEYGESAEVAAELALEEAGKGEPSWFRGVAFTTLILSIAAATAALIAGMTAHESLLSRTEEIVDLTKAESELVIVSVLRSKHEVLTAIGQAPDPDEVARVEEFEQEAERLETEAEDLEQEATETGSIHLIAALSATLFAVAIAVTGLSAIVRQRWLWIAGGVIGVVGGVTFGVAASRFFF